MQNPELLVLDLRAPLVFRSAAVPPSPASDLPSEGEEELIVFDPALLVTEDPDEGPRVRALPPASFRGSSRGEGLHYTIEPGRYAFMQLEAGDGSGQLAASLENFAASLEEFARDAWWEGARLEGPYLVRLLAEDGKKTIQLLRRHAP
jgi:hypothetical protein